MNSTSFFSVDSKASLVLVHMVNSLLVVERGQHETTVEMHLHILVYTTLEKEISHFTNFSHTGHPVSHNTYTHMYT